METTELADSLPESINRFTDLVRRDYSPPSVAAYAQALNLFLDHLRDPYRLAPAKLTPADVCLEWGISFLEYLQANRSIETEHLYSRVLLQYFRYLREQFDLPLGIEQLAEHYEAHRRQKSHAIPEIPIAAVAEIVEFAEHFQPPGAQSASSEREYLAVLRDKAFLLTLAHTGLRVSEICGLRCRHFDVSRQHVKADDGLCLSLPASALKALTAYLTARHKLDAHQQLAAVDLPLFARHDKRAGSKVLPISRWTGANIVELWVRIGLDNTTRLALERANQAITPHTFRHYFVFNALVATDKDIATAQMMARHGDRSTTRRYLQQLTTKTAEDQTAQ